MAKAILIFEDTEDSTVTVSAEFVPELKMDDPLTKAQQLAFDTLQGIEDGEDFMDKLAHSEEHPRG